MPKVRAFSASIGDSAKNRNPFFYEIYITHLRNAAKIIAEYEPAITGTI